MNQLLKQLKLEKKRKADNRLEIILILIFLAIIIITFFGILIALYLASKSTRRKSLVNEDNQNLLKLSKQFDSIDKDELLDLYNDSIKVREDNVRNYHYSRASSIASKSFFLGFIISFIILLISANLNYLALAYICSWLYAAIVFSIYFFNAPRLKSEISPNKLKNTNFNLYEYISSSIYEMKNESDFYDKSLKYSNIFMALIICAVILLLILNSNPASSTKVYSHNTGYVESNYKLEKRNLTPDRDLYSNESKDSEVKYPTKEHNKESGSSFVSENKLPSDKNLGIYESKDSEAKYSAVEHSKELDKKITVNKTSTSGKKIFIPSFDCNQQLSIVEKLICTNQTLATLDAKMAQVYLALINSDRVNKNDLKNTQKTWLSRREKCSHLNCIESLYNMRLKELALHENQPAAYSQEFTTKSENAYELGRIAANQGRFNAAYSIWSPLAHADHPKAQLAVGKLYLRGDGLRRDFKEGFKWIEKSAKKNNPEAQYYLGRLYENGDGVNRNLVSAEFWYIKASQNNYEDSKQALLNLRFKRNNNQF